MKRMHLVALLLVILSTMPASAAPLLGGLSLGIGPTVPVSGSFSDYHGAGYHVQATWGKSVLPFLFNIEGRFGYHAVPKDVLLTDPNGNVGTGADLKLWMFGVEGRLKSPPVPGFGDFYLAAGPGYAHVTESGLTGVTSGDVANFLLGQQNKAYFSIAAGANLSLVPPLSAFLEFRYIRIMTDDQKVSLVPITIGISF